MDRDWHCPELWLPYWKHIRLRKGMWLCLTYWYPLWEKRLFRGDLLGGSRLKAQSAFSLFHDRALYRMRGPLSYEEAPLCKGNLPIFVLILEIRRASRVPAH